jgi:hypothetical protein
VSVVSYTQPQTGLIDFLFGGGLLFLVLAAIGSFVWALSKLFGYVIPKTIGKNIVKGKKKVKK